MSSTSTTSIARTRPSNTRRIHLNLLIDAVGVHPGSWRHPLSSPERARTLDHFVEIARLAERGLFDALLFADSPAVSGGRGGYINNPFEPITLLAGIAARTEHIGLIATASTSFNEPYNLARFFASLDLISGGRAGWNAVTTSNPLAAGNFGQDALTDHTERYRSADEFIAVVRDLWESWDVDAVVVDRETGDQVRPGSVRRIDHEGRYYRVSGPLDVPPSPQGHPVLAQAGSSASGLALGAKYGSVIYTNQGSPESSREFSAALRAGARSHGRNPELIAITPGVVPFLGSTEREAHALKESLDAALDVTELYPAAERHLHVDLSSYDLDAPFPVELLPDPSTVTNSVGTYTQLAATIRSGAYTVRRAILRAGGGSIHREFVGTPEQFADDIELWTTTGASDGFTVMPPLEPHVLGVVVDEVVPLLQQRGLFRREYSGSTLAGHYGLPVPAGGRAGARAAEQTDARASAPTDGPRPVSPADEQRLADTPVTS